VSFLYPNPREVVTLAKGKYQYWLTEEGLTLLAGWARDGLTDEQIANNIGVSRETLNQWKHKYADISDTLKKGKEVVDYAVENALLNRALGGDTTAQIFWLKNRRPDKWRDKPSANNTEQSADDNFIAALDGRTEDVWQDE